MTRIQDKHVGMIVWTWGFQFRMVIGPNTSGHRIAGWFSRSVVACCGDGRCWFSVATLRAHQCNCNDKQLSSQLIKLNKLILSYLFFLGQSIFNPLSIRASFLRLHSPEGANVINIVNGGAKSCNFLQKVSTFSFRDLVLANRTSATPQRTPHCWVNTTT